MSANEWNERFGDSVYYYGETANEFLQHRHTLIPKDSKVLVLGDGEGRNGVFLARKRCKVTSVDASAAGLEKARALAAKHKVSIETIEAMLPNLDVEKGTWDVVVLIFLHLPEAERKAVHQLAIDALRPGGLLILEAFTPDQLGKPSGGPKTAERLYTAAMLREDFSGEMDIEGLAEVETVLNEGPGHVGPASVVRLLASKR